MIILDVDQGSPEWLQARVGVVTASAIAGIVTPARLQRAKSDYMAQLLAEWVLGQPLDEEWQGSYWTERGQALEPEARAWFELETGQLVKPAGFVYRDESRATGCSPDGLVVPNRVIPIPEAGLELKCPAAKTHIGYLLTGGLPPAYRMQVQASMWITGLERWHFMSYHPDLPPLHVACEPDADVFAALDEHVPTFLAELATAKDLLLADGVEPRTDLEPAIPA